MKRLLFVLLMMTCSLSWAEWERVGDTGNYEALVDRATIRKKGNFFEMWDMMNYFKVQESVGKAHKSAKILNRYDCKDATRGLVSFVHYSGEYGTGEVVFVHTSKKNEIEDHPISPGSSAELLWQIACGRK